MKKYHRMLIGLIAASIFSPIIIGALYLYGTKHIGIPTTISSDAALGYCGNIISGFSSVLVGLVAVKISKQANAINKSLMQQNDEISQANAENSIQPHFSLRVIREHLLATQDEQYSVPTSAYDIDGKTDQYTVIVTNDEVQLYFGEIRSINKYKKLSDYSLVAEGKTYVAIEVENVGCGIAIGSQIEFDFVDNKQKPAKTYIKDCRINRDRTRIEILCEKDVPRNATYSLVISYSNILGQKYRQQFEFSRNNISLFANRIKV